jgi:hypothetical protein
LSNNQFGNGQKPMGSQGSIAGSSMSSSAKIESGTSRRRSILKKHQPVADAVESKKKQHIQIQPLPPVLGEQTSTPQSPSTTVSGSSIRSVSTSKSTISHKQSKSSDKLRHGTTSTILPLPIPALGPVAIPSAGVHLKGSAETIFHDASGDDSNLRGTPLDADEDEKDALSIPGAPTPASFALPTLTTVMLDVPHISKLPTHLTDNSNKSTLKKGSHTNINPATINSIDSINNNSINLSNLTSSKGSTAAGSVPSSPRSNSSVSVPTGAAAAGGSGDSGSTVSSSLATPKISSGDSGTTDVAPSLKSTVSVTPGSSKASTLSKASNVLPLTGKSGVESGKPLAERASQMLVQSSANVEAIAVGGTLLGAASMTLSPISNGNAGKSTTAASQATQPKSPATLAPKVEPKAATSATSSPSPSKPQQQQLPSPTSPASPSLPSPLSTPVSSTPVSSPPPASKPSPSPLPSPQVPRPTKPHVCEHADKHSPMTTVYEGVIDASVYWIARHVYSIDAPVKLSPTPSTSASDNTLPPAPKYGDPKKEFFVDFQLEKRKVKEFKLSPWFPPKTPIKFVSIPSSGTWDPPADLTASLSKDIQTKFGAGWHRSHDYYLPMTNPLAPKQTKCIVEETVLSWNAPMGLCVRSFTRNPDVFDGFKSQVLMCVTYVSPTKSKVKVSCSIDFEKFSLIKGKQKSFCLLFVHC